MKRRKIILMVIFISLAMVFFSACSEDANVDANTDDASNGEVEKDVKGTRSNPIDLGETVEWKVEFYPDIDDWDALEGVANVTLNQVYEGEEAIEMLYFGSEALEDVEEGYIFAVADLTVELLEGDEDHPYTTSFEIASVSEDGRKSPFAYAMLADKYEDNEYTDLYPGGKVDLKQAFLVADGEEFLIEIEENISGTKFFKHK